MAIVSGETPATYLPKSVYVSNPSSNNISAYSIAHSTGALTPIAGSPFATGPFPWAISSDAGGRYLFTGNQGNLTVSAFTVDATTGALTPAPRSPFPVGSEPISVAVDNGAHYVYVCNNIDNTISGFSLSPSGSLTSLPGFPISTAPYTDVLTLTIDPRGKFLYIVAGTSNAVVAYAIDAGTGSLTLSDRSRLELSQIPSPSTPPADISWSATRSRPTSTHTPSMGHWVPSPRRQSRPPRGWGTPTPWLPIPRESAPTWAMDSRATSSASD
jgi:6-phosphogluconolactonase (cycloisomerase 2 family)